MGRLPDRPARWRAAWRLGRTGWRRPRRRCPARARSCASEDTVPRRRFRALDAQNPGDDLFSRKAALSVSSALESLTSVFGMGTGMASPPVSPGFLASGWLFGCTLRAAHRRRGRLSFVDLRFQRHDVDAITMSQPLTPGQLLKRSSPRPLVPLSFIRHRTSTCGLSNRWSPCGLTRLTRWGTSSRGELRT